MTTRSSKVERPPLLHCAPQSKSDTTANQRTLTAFFDMFQAEVQPSLRVRAQFDHAPDAFDTADGVIANATLTAGGDVVAFGSTVPEPATLALLGTGLLVAGFARRKRSV